MSEVVKWFNQQICNKITWKTTQRGDSKWTVIRPNIMAQPASTERKRYLHILKWSYDSTSAAFVKICLLVRSVPRCPTKSTWESLDITASNHSKRINTFLHRCNGTLSSCFVPTYEHFAITSFWTIEPWGRCNVRIKFQAAGDVFSKSKNLTLSIIILDDPHRKS